MVSRGQQPAGVKYCDTTLIALAYVPRKYLSLYMWMVSSVVECSISQVDGQGYKNMEIKQYIL